MVGSNEIHLNEATLIAALQHYFETVLFATGKAPIVNSVSSSSNYGSGVFKVELLSEKK